MHIVVQKTRQVEHSLRYISHFPPFFVSPVDYSRPRKCDKIYETLKLVSEDGKLCPLTVLVCLQSVKL